jgi:CD1 antigen
MSLPPPFFLFFAIGFGKPISFKFIQTSSFYNHSWIQNMVSGRLGELTTQDGIAALAPSFSIVSWYREYFSNKKWIKLQEFFQATFRA